MSATDPTASTIQRLEAELRRVTAERDTQRLGTCCVHAIEDPIDPNRAHIVRGTVEGIRALEVLLRQRFQDGVELGQAMADDAIAQKEAVINAMGARIRDMEEDLEHAS